MRTTRWLCLLLILLIGPNLSRTQTRLFAPESIVNKCMEVHGTSNLDGIHVEFEFRNRQYTFYRKGGMYEYKRAFTNDEGQEVQDILNNSGFKRKLGRRKIKLTSERQRAFSNSVNSVHYFAFLPLFLEDPAVQLQYLGETDIEGIPYFKIRVTFEEEKGGDDFDDEFIYWIHTSNYTMDFLAYSYTTNGGGVRFRKAINPRVVGGFRFQDYINYKYDKGTPVEKMDELFEEGKLEELSRIELNNIRINL